MVDYRNNKDKVKINCSVHGIFLSSPQSHLYGVGCPSCAKNQKMNKETFILKSKLCHMDKYDYSKSIYINSHKKLEIICKKHGSFYQHPYKHIQGRGCPKCKLSRGVTKICNILCSNNIDYINESTIDGCISSNGSPLKFDVYLPNQSIYIEYDGEQHFRPVKSWGGQKGFDLTIKRDKVKNEFCIKNNITLYRISYKDNIDEKMKEILSLISKSSFV